MGTLTRLGPVGEGVSGSVEKFLNQDGDELAGKIVWRKDTQEKWFNREVDLLIRLDHPCIVHFKGFAIEKNTKRSSYGTIFMNLAKRGSLQDVFKLQEKQPTEKVLDATQKATIILGIALGLNFVHALGALHRDIKPANVLLDADLHPMICDFGCSRFGGAQMTEGVGTPAYQAPELLDYDVEEQRYTTKVDVWAFALVMYQIMFDGKLWPRELLSAWGRMRHRILTGERPPIKEDPDRKWVSDLIQKCWQHNQDDRPGMPEILATLKSNNFDVLEGVESEKVMEYFLTVEETRAK
jgi:serine/threonine protein kinase